MSDGGFELNKKKGPYQGILIVIALMLGVPFVVNKLFMAVLVKPNATIKAIALATASANVFSGLIGVLFCAMLIADGLLVESFLVVIDRLKEFFEALIYENVVHACKWYWLHFKDKGAAFWIYLALILYNVFNFLESINFYVSHYM